MLALIMLIVAGPVFFRRVVFPADSDYSLHILYAQWLMEGRLGDVPLNTLAHPALQLILLALHLLSFRALGLYASLILVLVSAQVLTSLILFYWLKADSGARFAWRNAFWAGALTIVAPVMALVFLDGFYYFGYVGLANYHNPTVHLLRPIALLSFILGVRVFQRTRATATTVVASAGLLLLSAAVKPNFAMCLLPAITLVSIFRLSRREPVDKRLLVFGFLLPGTFVLLVEWAVGYGWASGEEARILIRPLAVEGAFSAYLLPKLLLSMLFPLAILWAGRGDAARDSSMLLAWLAFAIGAAQMYLLAEGGDRFYHGNFRWGAQIWLFLLFASSAKLLLQPRVAPGAPRSRRWVVGWAAFAAHLIAGVVYYAHVMVSSGYG